MNRVAKFRQNPVSGSWDNDRNFTERTPIAIAFSSIKFKWAKSWQQREIPEMQNQCSCWNKPLDAEPVAMYMIWSVAGKLLLITWSVAVSLLLITWSDQLVIMTSLILCSALSRDYWESLILYEFLLVYYCRRSSRLSCIWVAEKKLRKLLRYRNLSSLVLAKIMWSILENADRWEQADKYIWLYILCPRSTVLISHLPLVYGWGSTWCIRTSAQGFHTEKNSDFALQTPGLPWRDGTWINKFGDFSLANFFKKNKLANFSTLTDYEHSELGVSNLSKMRRAFLRMETLTYHRPLGQKSHTGSTERLTSREDGPDAWSR